jgi:hypothetical protein
MVISTPNPDAEGVITTNWEQIAIVVVRPVGAAVHLIGTFDNGEIVIRTLTAMQAVIVHGEPDVRPDTRPEERTAAAPAAEIIEALLARDVLALLDALAKAERERDQALARVAELEALLARPADAGTARVEWGHRLDPGIADYEAVRPEFRDEIELCHDEGRCDRPTVDGWLAVHVWRLVTSTGWQTGPAPEVARDE